jgi:hypothetical protein
VPRNPVQHAVGARGWHIPRPAPRSNRVRACAAARRERRRRAPRRTAGARRRTCRGGSRGACAPRSR